MKEPAQEFPGVLLDNETLPFFEHDPSLVLSSRAMLWKQAWPVFPVEFDFEVSALLTNADSATGLDSLQYLFDALIERRVSMVVEDCQPVDAVSGVDDVAVTQVPTQ